MKLSLCQIKPDRDWKTSLDIAHQGLKQAWIRERNWQCCRNCL